MSDTICAIATPGGVGGIAVIRVSGSQAVATVSQVWRGKPLEAIEARRATLGLITDSAGQPLDEAVVTVYRAPASYTGEDTVEISVHGSRWIQQELLNTLIGKGARLAEPGEFTRRAFASGRIDLTEAEAIADLIDSTSRASHRVAMSQMQGDLRRRLDGLREQLLELASLVELELDFGEEDVEFADRSRLVEIATQVERTCRQLASTFATGAALREGIPVAIVGATNAGKSTLLNLLLGHQRAIVSPIHGTTRDTIDATTTLRELPFRFIDTAGLRATDDPVEALGIERSAEAARSARIIIRVIDATAPVATELPASEARVITVLNKADLLSPEALAQALRSAEQTSGLSEAERDGGMRTSGVPAVVLSARRAFQELERRGCAPDQLPELQPLLDSLAAASGLQASAQPSDDEAIIITNARHYQALSKAAESAALTLEGLQTGLTSDLVAIHLRDTLTSLGEITGQITPATILESIFSRFCIGK